MDLNSLKQSFNSIGWFLPPYLSVGFLNAIKANIDTGKISTQEQLELTLVPAFSPDHLAAMVCERYSVTPYIQEYAEIIAESVEAHFSGLNHVAVAGLTPVIEGAARKLLESRALRATSVKDVFARLADDCIVEVTQNNIGQVNEIVTMIDSFKEFTRKFLYTNSSTYPLSDNTNRHGILHGAYTDAEYGCPISFYKIMGALDFLCLISSLRAKVSWLAPDPTERSRKTENFYLACIQSSKTRPSRT